MVGGLVYKRLIANGIKHDAISFVVSETTTNQCYMDCPLIVFDEYSDNNSSIIVVATLEKNHKQIIETLIRHNIDNYIVVDNELYEDLEKCYVNEYLTNNPVIEEERQILFMSSDNNSSSGAFLCLLDLNIELKKRGIKALIVLPMYGTGESLLQENELDFTYVLSKDWLGEIGRPIRNLACNDTAIEKLVSFIYNFNIQLVHINTTYSYVGAEAAIRTGVPYIWHIREFIKEQGFWFYDENKSYNMINASEYIIPVSRYVGNCYTKMDKEKFCIIYDGVDIDRFWSDRKVLLNEEISILMPGTLIPLKGQKQLIEAAYCLKGEGFKFKISFVGNGDADYISELRQLIDNYDLGDLIKFVERTNAIESLYRSSDIVIVCSRAEAFGRVTVEAQLSGCVVIGAKCGATAEIISDYETGIFYELDNCNDLADKIKWVVYNRKQANLIATAGRDYASSAFSKEINADRVVDIYDYIIRK